MTTCDFLFVCGTLILMTAGAFVIACLTRHPGRWCYGVCFSNSHVHGRKNCSLYVSKTISIAVGAFVLSAVFFFSVAHARVDRYHLTCSQFSPSVVVHSACVRRPPRRTRSSHHGVLRISVVAVLLVRSAGDVHTRRLPAVLGTRLNGRRRHRCALRSMHG